MESSKKVLKSLERNDAADEIFQDYFTASHEFDYLRLRFIEDSEIRSEVEKQIRDSKQPGSICEIVTRMIRNSSYSQEDIATLQSYSVGDWFTFFKEELKANNEHFVPYVRKVLELESPVNATIEDREVSVNAATALRRILLKAR